MLNESNQNNLSNYSESINNLNIQYEYLTERNEQLDKIVKQILKRSSLISSLPNFLLVFFKRKHKNLIKLSYIAFDSIEKNKNNMIELEGLFTSNLNKLKNTTHTNKNMLLNEYLEFKKSLDKQIEISYNLLNELQVNLSVIEDGKKELK